MIHLSKIQLTEGFNTNNIDAETPEIDITETSTLSLYIWGESGGHDNHKIELSVSGSDDDRNSLYFIDLNNSSITKEGFKSVDVSGFCWAKVKVVTVEGADSLSNILINTFKT